MGWEVMYWHCQAGYLTRGAKVRDSTTELRFEKVLKTTDLPQ